MVGESEELIVDWNEAEDYGPGEFRVPFSCAAEVSLSFYVFYADAYVLPDDIHVSWGDPDETKFFEAEATATVQVAGHLTVTLYDWPDSDDFDVSIDNISTISLVENENGDVV